MALDGLRRAQTRVSETGDAAAESGAVAISGSNTGDITITSGPVARSDYLTQIRRMIAPHELLGRERELEELVSYCTAVDANPYLYLRAKAWSGKSALLSWFVLSPPEKVKVVSFFITARLAGNSDRLAFSEVLIEQLAEMLDEPMPALLTDATRDAHLLGLLERAANKCKAQEKRLVLVVDGLDEDSGVTAGPNAYSVAALLPTEPPGSMRIIVSGRPNPPIPSDVPDRHPLRSLKSIRALAVSPYAEVVRQDAQRELKRLLQGSQAEQDLLGLLTASGGGLSGEDLAELTGWSSWEVGEYLGAVSGRTFGTRAGRWQSDTTVYVLGHEELQQYAVRFLGTNRLRTYRERLHSWADEYRVRTWPSGTPEYLLRGYYRLLVATTDLPRMIACAVDAARHDRMLDITGGDTAALFEITSAQDAVAHEDLPDLGVMIRIAFHRTRLHERNVNIPAALPGAWAQIGKFGRAEALARSVTDPFRQVQALAAVARAIAKAGDAGRAVISINHGEAACQGIADPSLRAQALASVARAALSVNDKGRGERLINWALAEVEAVPASSLRGESLAGVARAFAVLGEFDRAESLIGSFRHRALRSQALVAVSQAAAVAGDSRRAKSIAASIGIKSFRSQALAAIAHALAQRGQKTEAYAIALKAEAIARHVSDPAVQGWTLTPIARAFAAAGKYREARRAAKRAEAVASRISRRSLRDKGMVTAAAAMAASGELKEAGRIADSIAAKPLKAKALARIASEVAAGGNCSEAESIASQAERLGRSIGAPGLQDRTLAVISRALAEAGSFTRAEEVAMRVHEASVQDGALIAIAEKAAMAGSFETAERVAKSIPRVLAQMRAVVAVVGVMRDNRNSVRAQELVAYANRMMLMIDDPATRRQAAVVLAKKSKEIAQEIAKITQNSKEEEALPGFIYDDLLARITAVPVDQRVTTVVLVTEAMDSAKRISALVGLAKSLAVQGDLETGERLAELVEPPYPQARILTTVAHVALLAGDVDRARGIVRGVNNVSLRVRALCDLAEAMRSASIGSQSVITDLLDEAETLARSIDSKQHRDRVLVGVARSASACGQLRRGELIVRSIANDSLRAKAFTAMASAVTRAGEVSRGIEITRSIADPKRQAHALSEIAQISASAGDLEQAQAIATLIADPTERERVQTKIFGLLATSGDYAAAERLASSINDSSRRAQAFIALAESNPAELERLIAQVLQTGNWQASVPVLARLRPLVIEALTEELFLELNAS
ncbi:hypothetical protein ABZ749_02930 [Micromonospora sp. NPDC047753]|uniref:hypothetical protein n=1 Tax=Micromonospora sp. NPDC047753 TaxID=3154817 RepID=UPI0033F22EF3